MAAASAAIADFSRYSKPPPLGGGVFTTDRDTGQSRGFGFVEMPDTTAAKSAMQGANGKELAGRALTVNEARPREPRREPRQDRW